MTSTRKPWLLKDSLIYVLFLLLPMCVYYACASHVLGRHGLGVKIYWADWIQSYGTMMVIFGIGAGVSGVWAIKLRLTEKERLDKIWLRIVRPYATPRLFLRAMVIMVVDTFLIVVYLSLKQFTPILNDMLFDDALIAMDRAIHFGIDPYPAWILPFPPMVGLIQTLYIGWFGLKIPIFAYYLFKPTAKSVHFFASYFLLFVLAGSLAVVFPSLGPVYVIPHEQVDAIRADTTTEVTQKAALQWYWKAIQDPYNYERNPIGGLAAFPSLHVGMVALMTIFFCRMRRLRWVSLVYLVIIEFGSVYLGWHYALDGYFTILFTLILVWALGLALEKVSGERMLNPIQELIRMVRKMFGREHKAADEHSR
ncbi:MAG: phosphatase PAP2 family protein [Acidobacteria bacterium]|nr:phosphatase PAP2 family protein [Acidobacteriota bacterium]